MNMWILIALIIEVLAVVGTISVWATKRVRAAFVVGFNTMIPVTGVYLLWTPPLNTRKIIIFAMVAVYLAHMNWLLLFRHRYTAAPKLEKGLPASQKYLLSFMLANAVGWGYCLPFYFAAQRTGPIGPLDLASLAVYVVGTIIHFGSDYQKLRFKARPESRGKLLDTGFWALCRHPNYFGDFLIYVAFGLIGGSVWGWVSPLLNLLQYLFDAIPKSEKWAAERYGEAWEAYVRRTKMFVPYIY